MPKSLDIRLPEFNNDHSLSPSGDEPLEDRMWLWNERDLEHCKYMEDYWFLLGFPDNQALLDSVHEAERSMSWSTARELRWQAVQSRGAGLHKSARSGLTLGDAVEIGWSVKHEPQECVVVLESRQHFWIPPLQVHLDQPNFRIYNGRIPFEERLGEYRKKRDQKRKTVKRMHRRRRR